MKEQQKDIDNVGNLLLDALQEASIITENTNKNIKAQVKLMEVLSKPDEDFLMESNTPNQYIGNKNVLVSLDRFMQVWTNYQELSTDLEVSLALGYPSDEWDRSDSRRKHLNRMAKHFIQTNPNLANQIAPSLSARKDMYSAASKKKSEDEGGYLDALPVPSIQGVYPGRRGQRKPSTNVILKLNDEQLVEGEFYNDMSRIPRGNFRKFMNIWRLFISKAKEIRNRILGQPWNHIFILGYQMDRRFTIEIWYDSATSMFFLYDQNATELTTPTITLQECLANFITFLLRRGGELDKNIFQGRTLISREFATSYLRSLTNELGKDRNSIERANKLLSHEQVARDREKKKPLITAKGTWNVTKAGGRLAGRGTSTVASSVASSVRKGFASAKKEYDHYHGLDNPPIHPHSRLATGVHKKNVLDVANDVEDAIAKTAGNMNSAVQSAYINASNAYAIGERSAKAFVNSVVRNKAAKAFATVGLTGAIFSNYRYLDQSVYDHATSNPSHYRVLVDTILDMDGRIQKLFSDLAKVEEEKKRASSEFLDELKRRSDDLRRQLTETTRNRNNAVKRLQVEFGVDPFSGNDPMDPFSGKRSGRRVNENVNESIDFDEDTFDPMAAELERDAVNRRHMASRDPATVMLIKSHIMDGMIEQYEETKLRPNDVARLSSGFELTVTRAILDKIKVVKYARAVFNRIKMFIVGTGFRADFVVGFSLRDQINIEIWYVTEPNKNGRGTNSSFYVLDVTAKKIVRANLPYYRNAVTVVMAKIGTI